MFCKFSNEMKGERVTPVDNYFITECIPYLPAEVVKVYIYGLYKCLFDENNTIDDFAYELDMTKSEIEEIFWFLSEKKLVLVNNLNPIEVIYLSPHNKKVDNNINVDKYENFIVSIQSYFEGQRQLSPSEINSYIEIMDRYKMEPEAMLRIVKFCIDYKKNKGISTSYIIQVAKNWANEKILNLEAVENKIIDLEKTNAKLLDILKGLGLRRSATMDEMQLYLKWTQTFGFSYETIMYVVKIMKKKGGTPRLDNLLTKYFEKGLYSEKEIEAYQTKKDDLYNLAIEVCRTLGKYYDVYDNVVDTYIIQWNNKGFSDEMIKVIANYCFRASIRTLEVMDDVIQKLFKIGIVNIEGLNQYLNDLKSKDEKIKTIFEKLGINKMVRQKDRLLYNTWIEDWKMNDDLIIKILPMCLDKTNQLSYLNKILADYKNRGITTVEKFEEEMKKQPPKTTNTTGGQNETKSKLSIMGYTNDDLVAMFESLDEVEL